MASTGLHTAIIDLVFRFPLINSYSVAWIWAIFVVLSKYENKNAEKLLLYKAQVLVDQGHVYRLFFVISFIFSSIRIMRIFAADSFFGSIVVMMKKMASILPI